jgi:hypothetical protein
MKKPLISKVPGHEGLCKPTWLNNNVIDNRLDGGITGFFKNVKKLGPFYFKTGKEFHGIILADNKIHSTEIGHKV